MGFFFFLTRLLSFLGQIVEALRLSYFEIHVDIIVYALLFLSFMHN